MYWLSMKYVVVMLVIMFTPRSDFWQMRDETSARAKGAAEAVYELYEVVTHELLSSDLRYRLAQWCRRYVEC